MRVGHAPYLNDANDANDRRTEGQTVLRKQPPLFHFTWVVVFNKSKLTVSSFEFFSCGNSEKINAKFGRAEAHLVGLK